MVSDLVELGVEDMLQYNPHEDNLQNAEPFPILDEESEVTPEWEEQRGQIMARGHVVHGQKTNSILIGRFIQSSIWIHSSMK